MSWPRGRYNGKRIVGLSVKLQIDVSHWNWKPIIVWRSCGGIHWLCFFSWTEWVYADN